MADLDPGLIAVLVISVFFLVWYYAAHVYSRRLVSRIANEWKEAVLALGGSSKVSRIGSTAFRMSTEAAAAPFREVSATITLRPREMPINWALGKAQGRRDSALVEASLRTQPKVAFELVDPATRIGQRRKRARSDWSPASIGVRAMLLAAEDEGRVTRILESLGPDALASIAALHVSAGSTPGIAASVSVRRGDATRGLAAIRTLADRLVG